MEKINLALSKARDAKILDAAPEKLTAVFGKDGGGVTLEGVVGTKHRYVVGDLKILEDHCIPLLLRIYAKGEEEERFIYRFGILPGVKIRVCFDLDLMDMRTIFTTRRPGLLKIVCHGHRILMDEVDRFELGMAEVFHDCKVELSDFYMDDQEPAEFPVPDEKLVDEFGQWKKKEWPGKVHSFEELKEVVKANEGPLEYPTSRWDKWGGCLDHKLGEGTGFFTTKKVDGRWYLVDPDGYEFFSNGVCHVCMHNEDKIDGLEPFFEWLPPRGGDFEQFYKDYDVQRMPYMPVEHRINYNWAKSNVFKVYGENWEEQWRENTYHILSYCGMNTMGSHPDIGWGFGSNGMQEYLDRHGLKKEGFKAPATKIPYTQRMHAKYPVTKDLIFRDFPDVLSDEFKENADIFAQALETFKGDPMMIGYFLSNEPEFNFVEDLVLADEVLYHPTMTACRAGLKQFLTERYSSIEKLNETWGASFESFDDFDKSIRDCSKISKAAEKDLREYSAFLMREYCRIPSEACRKVDPDHLNLGLRWSKAYNADMCAGWEYFDVFSLNCYSFDPTIDMDFAVKAGVDLPIMLTEFHMGALDRGMLATGLKGVKTQNDRAIAWRYVCEHVAAHPYGVGAHWHMFADNSCVGWYDGENYNNGMIDVCTRMYPELTGAMHESMQSIYEVRQGRKAPFDQMAEKIPMIGY